MLRVCVCAASALVLSIVTSAQPAAQIISVRAAPVAASAASVEARRNHRACGGSSVWEEIFVAAQNLTNVGRYGEAQECLLTARDRLIASEDAQDLQRLVVTYSALGSLRREQGNYGEAETLYRRAIELLERVSINNKDRAFVRLLNDLASLYLDAKLYGKSERISERSIGIQELQTGSIPALDAAESRMNLGAAHSALGRHREAEAAYIAAEQILHDHALLDTPEATSLWNNLAVLYAKWNAPQKAAIYIRRSLEATGDLCTRSRALVLTNLGLISTDAGLFPEANAAFAKATDCASRTFGAEHPQTLEVLSRYASFLRKTKRKAEAGHVELRVQAIRAKLGDAATAIYTVDAIELRAANDRSQSRHNRRRE